MEKLKKNSFIMNLSRTKYLLISHSHTREIYKKNSLIFYEGSESDRLFLIGNGKVKVFLRFLEDGDFFGEVGLINGFKRTSTVYALADSEIFSISKETFEALLDKHLSNYLMKIISHRDSSILLDELYYILFLGKGRFGSVCLAHNKKNFNAVKSVSRKDAETKPGLADFIINEKEVLLSLSHPFIVRLVKTLKNDFFFFYIIEYINVVNFESTLDQE